MTFVVLTLPCYFISDNKMFDLTRKIMFQREPTMVGTVFDAPVICCYDVVLMGQYSVR